METGNGVLLDRLVSGRMNINGKGLSTLVRI